LHKTLYTLCKVAKRPAPSIDSRAVRRLAFIALGAVIVVAGLYGLLRLFSERDSSGVADRAASGPGRLEPERPGAPPTGGEPPTSGAHEQRNVTREGRLGADELLTALEQGNVVLVHPGARPPDALRRLQEDVSGPFDAELAAAGQMVVLARWPGVEEVQALAWRRRLVASGPGDPQLRAFAEAWLGQGRGNTG
jgi:uncharacterized protein DUF3105